MKSSLSSKDFKRVLREGCRASYGDIKFTYRLNFRHSVGFTVSKKYGNAVNRNLLKRRCRHAYDMLFVGQLFNCSIVVSPTSSGLSYKKINIAFMLLIKHINGK